MECNVFSQIEKEILADKDIRKVVTEVLTQIDEEGAVSVHKIGDEKMRELNRKYRDIDGTTDVLSFSMGEGEQYAPVADLGDIFISVPKIKKQAKEQEVSPKEEFKRVLIHGVLHLLGYDHQQPEESEEMFSLQKKLLKQVT